MIDHSLSHRQFSILFNWATEQKSQLEEVANIYGSSFEKALMDCFRKADHLNKLKIMINWSQLFLSFWEFKHGKMENI